MKKNTPRRKAIIKQTRKPPPNKIPVKNSTWGIIWLNMKRLWALYCFILLLLTGLFFWKPLRKLFLSDKEVFQEQKFPKGFFIPLQVDPNNDTLTIKYGGSKEYFSIKSLGEDVPTEAGLFSDEDGVHPFDLKLMIKHNNLFISAVFRDINNEDTVGIIDMAKWIIIQENAIKYPSTDSTLLVIDKSDRVIFKMAYKKPNTLYLNGYSLSRTQIVVISEDRMTQFNYAEKNAAIEQIKTISRSFD